MTTAPGARNRAVRLRLTIRLAAACHAADLLHNKEQALQRERSRLEGHTDRTERDWARRCEQATTWLMRARALGASDELARLIEHGPDPASIDANWQSAMGIMYPGAVTCSPGTTPPLVSTSALRPTVDAYRDALDAAATHASTPAALRRLDHELASTRRRRRAIGERLVPQLEQALHELDLHLDEQDREEALRVQLAVNRQERRAR
jgi:V/A-type H+-transporting ATPase subunit D